MKLAPRPVLLLGMILVALSAGPLLGQAQITKNQGAAAMEPGPLASTLAIKPGEALGEMAMVLRPPAVRGALSWTIETKTHRGAASSFSVSPDGALVATGGYDGVVRIWDAADGKLLRALVGHSSSVYDVAFSPDGSLLASSGSLDKTARIWNPKTGMTVRILKNHKSFTSKLAWAPDGKMLVVTGGASGFATFWDLVGHKHLRTIEQGTPIGGVAWSPDGKAIACASNQNAFLWNAADGANLATFRMEKTNVFSVGWSPDSRFLLTGGIQSTAVWDVESRKIVAHLSGTGRLVAWSPDGSLIVTSFGVGMQIHDAKTHFAGRSRQMDAHGLAWDKKTGNLFIMTPSEVHRLDLKDESRDQKFAIADADTLVWTPGRPIVSGINDKTLRLWDPITGKPTVELSGHTDRVLATAWSADGKLLASGAKDQTAKVWDAKTAKLLRSLGAHNGPVRAVAWSSDGKLATAGDDGTVRVFVPNSDKPIELKGNRPVVAAAWSRQGKLASGGEDGVVQLWNLETGKPAKTLEVHRNVMSVSFAPDGNLLAAGADDDLTHVFNVASHKQVATLDPKTGKADFHALAWSPDNSLIATTDYRLLLWNAKTGAALHGFQMAGPAHNVSFTPDGRTVVAGCLDRAIRFCETSTGRLRGTIVGDRKQMVSISAEGHYRSAPDLDADLVYVVQTDRSLDLYDANSFRAKFGWKNNPAAVKLTGN